MRPGNTTRWLWHADKLFFGTVLLVCALAVLSFWRDGPRQAEVPTLPLYAPLALAPIEMPSIEPRMPDIATGLATDPDEYLPRPGEHVCVNPKCTRILPDGTVRCPKCGAVQNDRDGDGMGNKFEARHVATDPDVPDGHLDYDRDKFTNKEEYDAGSNPDDPNSIPAPIRLVGVGREFVDVLFRGVYVRPNGERVIQLNWGSDTHTSILQLGSSFRGYRLEKLNERRVLQEGQHPYWKTEYELVLKRPDSGELVLPRHTPVREPERYGIFATSGTPKRTVRAYAGMTFEADGHTYVVMQVSPHSARLTGDRGEHYDLERRPE